MVQPLSNIQAPIAEELKQFDKHFRQSMKSPVPLLDRITFYIVRRKGKQIRPMFVFLSAKLFGEIGEATHLAASLVEILHTASLVHDDVVDGAMERRGFFSINALWKNKIAVLVGDYLFSQGMLLALKNQEFKLLEIVSDAVKAMSEGELLQIEKARRLDIKESIYYDIIRQKTASLIASACCAGAASVTDNQKDIERMHQFGEKIGIAFQIRDDLFDFGFDDVGKPLGIDIKEKKLTLPLIYSLQNASAKDRRHIIRLVSKHNDNPEKVKEVIQFVRDSQGMTYARDVMYKYRDDAFELLSDLPKSESRQALRELVNFVTERKK